MIGIRVDSNEYLASGHLMRCLSIADALFSLNEEVVFFTSDDYAKEIVEKRGFKIICLNSVWDDKDGELEVLLPQIEKYKLKMLLVDSYQVTECYLTELHKIVKMAYLDDLNAFDYPVDIVINYSIYADEMDYPANKTYLLGMNYVPLRKQFNYTADFLKKSVKKRRKGKQILITTGASDPYLVAEKVVREILRHSELNDYGIAVVRGRFWDSEAFDNECVDYLGQNVLHRVSVYENVENMAELMLESSMAVSAGGSTLYELCACCVPTVCFSYADNQLQNVNGFASRRIMEYAGDARNSDDIGHVIVQKLLTYHNNDDIISEVMGNMKKTGIENGAVKLATKLIEFIR